VPALGWGLTLTSSGLAEDAVREPLRIERGHAVVPEGSGLGIDVDEQRLRGGQQTRMVA
jgi:L-alanine-DL-glutamate epimerase-like enolase superfamily enzyme